MNAGQDPRKEKEGVLVYPENWEDMVKKYQEREEEQLKKLMEKRQVETFEELQTVARGAIHTRAIRTASEHQTLKNHSILREEKSEDIKTLRQALNKEITNFAREVMKQYPSLKGHPALKGRVTVGAPEEKFAEAVES